MAQDQGRKTVSSQSNPFKRTTVILMFVVGFAAFIALLYGIGAGDRLASSNNGEAHGASNSIVGYKALASLLEKTGTPVRYSRNAAAFEDSGLLIVTPNPYTEADKLAEIVTKRTYIGPTIIILPKWQVAAMPTLKKGWVNRFGILGPDSSEVMLKDIVDVKIKAVGPEAEVATNTVPPNILERDKKTKTPVEIAQSSIGGSVPLPETHITINSENMQSVISDPESGDVLIGVINSGEGQADMEAMEDSEANVGSGIYGDGFLVTIVADADLMNNAGMANKQVAQHAITLIKQAGGSGNVTFDLTMNGLGSSDNLLTLAFKPPFLSATIALIIAALAAAWMAFNRFGPPAHERRSIEFGKTALVNNSAALIGKMQRQHLVADPYGEMIRSDALRAIGISLNIDRAEGNRKLDELGEVNGNRFTSLLNDLNRAENANDTANRAAALYEWKKEITG